jgi:hypothetical protein
MLALYSANIRALTVEKLISPPTAFRSHPPVSLLGKAEFQTLTRRIFIEFKLWLFLVTNIT